MYISKELQEYRINKLMMEATIRIAQINEKFYNKNKIKSKIGVKKND